MNKHLVRLFSLYKLSFTFFFILTIATVAARLFTGFYIMEQPESKINKILDLVMFAGSSLPFIIVCAAMSALSAIVSFALDQSARRQSKMIALICAVATFIAGIISIIVLLIFTVGALTELFRNGILAPTLTLKSSLPISFLIISYVLVILFTAFSLRLMLSLQGDGSHTHEIIPGLIARTPTPQDINDAYGIFQEVYPDNAEAWNDLRIRKNVSNSAVLVFHKKVIGFYVMDKRTHELKAFLIKPGMRKQGYGSFLHREFLDRKSPTLLLTHRSSGYEQFFIQRGWGKDIDDRNLLHSP